MQVEKQNNIWTNVSLNLTEVWGTAYRFYQVESNDAQTWTPFSTATNAGSNYLAGDYTAGGITVKEWSAYYQMYKDNDQASWNIGYKSLQYQQVRTHIFKADI